MTTKFCFLFILIFFIPQLLYPCRCRGVSVVDGVEKADIVFKGVVLSVTKTSSYEDVGLEIDTAGLNNMIKQSKDYPPLYYVTMEIEALYKGEYNDTIKILTPVSGASCGYRYFEKEESYIVYANKEDFYSRWKLDVKPLIYLEADHYWTNHCTRTSYWYKEEEDQILEAVEILNSSGN